MKKGRKFTLKRILAGILAVAMICGYLPTGLGGSYIAKAEGTIFGKVSDPDTHDRAQEIFAGTTLNAGRVMVGKFVNENKLDFSKEADGASWLVSDPENFLIAISQASQAVGVSSEIPVPVDAVFVLDTSGSMAYDIDSTQQNNVSWADQRATHMVTAANDAIESLLAANSLNRVAVVAFSDSTTTLSTLHSYTGTAATEHLTWDGNRIVGRRTNGNTGSSRNGKSGGTNIHAGIVAGAQILAEATDTTVTIGGKEVTRIPFLIVLSDGAPTFSGSSIDWTKPTGEQGPGNGSYAGNGFLPVLTASYYKNIINQKYFGENVSSENHTYMYTIGVGVDGLSATDKALAEITLNPKDNMKAGNQFYENDTNHDFKYYWEQYQADKTFEIRVDSDETYTIGEGSYWENQKENWYDRDNWVEVEYDNHQSSVKSLLYNDSYYPANNASGLEAAFRSIVVEIQKRAIAYPTLTNESMTADYSGYVTFRDVIGEYMEVKDMKGVIADGQLFRGEVFAKFMNMKQTEVDGNADAEAFMAALIHSMEVRFGLRLPGETDEVHGSMEKFLNDAWNWAHDRDYDGKVYTDGTTNPDTQMYYKSSADFDNSICWWGHTTVDGSAQLLGWAADDSIEYIETAKQMAADGENYRKGVGTAVAEGADYVARSYFFYGSADGSTSYNKAYLDFSVTVMRELNAPYTQTVVISAPASLLAMQRVLIYDTDKNGNNKVYFDEIVPTRVVYEVGLRDDITAESAENILSDEYKKANKVDGGYTFYTNEWLRNPAEGEAKALTSATFSSDMKNAYYVFDVDTPIYVKQGNSYVKYNGTAKPSGDAYYYAHEYYTWDKNATVAQGTAGVAGSTVKVEYVKMNIPNDSVRVRRDSSQNCWVVMAGTYKAQSLVESGIEEKAENKTGSGDHIAHPVRTGGETEPKYAVYLGNNGKLTLATAEAKSVFNASGDDIDGRPVMVGDELTYQISATNTTDGPVDVIIEDTIPLGTELVEGSVKAYKDGVLQSGEYDFAQNASDLSWKFGAVTSGTKYIVEFKVKVTVLALDVDTVSNQASVTIGNNKYKTNMVSNPVEGKKATGATSTVVPADGVQVGDQIIYTIQYYNDTNATADVKIVDRIPTGTAYVAGSASNDGTLASGALTWTIKNVAAGTGGSVSFKVEVTAAALTVNSFTNTATIQIGNNAPTQSTNEVKIDVKVGDLVLSKVVKKADDAGLNPKADQKFVLVLTETSGKLKDASKEFALVDTSGNAIKDPDNNNNEVKVKFDANSQAKVTIKAGQTIVVKGLPVGVTIVVTEEPVAGYTPSYAPRNSATIVENASAQDAASVKVTNTYAPESTDDLWGLDYINFYKHLVSNGSPLSNKTFAFVAHPANADGTLSHEGSSVIHGSVTVNSGADVKIVFDELRFTKTGTYYFLVDETVGSDPGITYDIKEFLLKVEVYDDGTGKLKIKEDSITLQTRPDVNGTWSSATKADAVFTNEYTPAVAEVELVANKLLNNRDLNDIGFAFTFEVVDKDNNVVVVAQNDATGNIKFPKFNIGTVGEYTYTIREVNGGRYGYTYDTDKFTVTVKVTDDGLGELDAEVVYPTGGVVFENTYTPDKIKVALEASKKLTGRALVAGEFEFKVVGEEDGTDLTARNDAVGNILFPEIEYDLSDAGKTYTYIITEVAGNDTRITYNADKITITVAVSYDRTNGILSADVTYPNDTQFENVFNPPVIEVAPHAIKVTENKTSGDEEFTFEIYKDANSSVIATGTSGLNGAISFNKNLSFSQPGTYHYWIKEVEGKSAGITYDKAVYVMKVVVTADETTGLLSATTEYGVVANVGDTSYTTAYGEAVFVNVYKVANGSLTIVADKVLHGRDFKSSDVFTFVLKDSAGGVLDTAIADINKAGLITFDAITYTQAGDYTYTIEESSDNLPPGVSRDQTIYTIKVKVTNVSATYQAEITEVKADGVIIEQKAIVFTNTYAPKETSITLGDGTNVDITKELNGRPMVDGEFSFQLRQVGGTHTDTKTNQLGKVKFDEITYTSAGIYIYTIKEVAGDVAGVIYNTTEYTVTVTVTDNTETGKLEAAVTKVQKDGVDVDDNKTVQFVNTYKAKETSIKIEATKRWKILKGDRELKAGDFDFVLEDAHGHKLVATNDASGKIVFENHQMLTFTEAGEYTYTVYEVKESLGGVDYDDETAYKVVVTVVDNTEEGQLEASISSVKKNEVEVSDKKIEFNNQYTAAPTSLRLTAKKNLSGRPLVVEEFRFEAQEVLAGGTPGDVKALGWNDKDGNILFNAISFDTIGEYTFKVYEAHGDRGGVTYDENYYMVVIKVEDNKDGHLVASIKSITNKSGADVTSEGITFNNSYKPADTSITLGTEGTVDISKVLTGRPLKDGEFSFILIGDGIDGLMIATNDADGKVVFDKINYTYAMYQQSKTYTYEIYELGSGATRSDGVTIDGRIYTVTVTLTDNLEGQLVASVAKVEEGTNEITNKKITFENSYRTGNAQITFKGDKKVDGHYFDITAGKFNFVVKDLAGNVITAAAGSNVAAVNKAQIVEIAFGTITYTFEDYLASDTYTYIISEAASNIPGMTDDKSEIMVTVRLTDDGKGTLTATATYPNTEGKVTFTNTYKPTATSVVLQANKKLEVEGGDMELTKDRFSFYVAEKLSNGEYLVLENKGNETSGLVEFSAIELTKAGTYVYAIGENVGHDGVGGITYDHDVYLITVEAVDKNGQLEADITGVQLYDGKKVVDLKVDDAREFVNIYTAKAAEAVIHASKELAGKDLEDKEFRFLLEDEKGNKLYAYNDGDGMITFKKEFTTVGTYKFTLSEAPESVLDNITYDANKYQVTVEVVDDKLGQLHTHVSYGTDKATTAPIFKNTYTPDSAKVILEALKELVGRDLKAEEFTFEVKDEAGTVVATGKNDADGKIVFDEINLAVGEYSYTISEVVGEAEDTIYDKNVYKVKVEVTDVDKDGVLETKITYPENGVKFINEHYEAVDTGDNSQMILWGAMAVLCVVVVGALVVIRKKMK